MYLQIVYTNIRKESFGIPRWCSVVILDQNDCSKQPIASRYKGKRFHNIENK